MDPEKYPLTTQGGLDYKHQKLINSFNYDSLVRMVQDGKQMSDEQIAIKKELEEKLERNFKEDVKNIEACD